MKLVFVLFDSLNRHALSPYNSSAIPTSAFERLAKKSVTFNNHYVGSMPCMPARRDIMTGRLNFLHRAWGPLEPFDNAFPEILRRKNVYTHLITDHYHYFEDGGTGFHGRYNSWEFIRGQEKDKWRGIVSPDIERLKKEYHPLVFDGRTDMNANLPYVLSREVIKQEEDFPLVKCFNSAFDFLKANASADNWMLQLECFDPHEPFFSPEKYKDRAASDYEGPVLDWLPYGRADLSGPESRELRENYTALVKMCDDYLGRLLDYFDENNLWEDTALIVSTDHGLLLGEHEYWGKNRPPFYDEVSHIPLFVHDPRAQQYAGQRREALTQTTDIMPTILDLFDADIPTEVQGHSLIPLLHKDIALRDACIYGQFGGAINVTDGRYTYFRYQTDSSVTLYNYTLMPMHMRTFFEPIELREATLREPFNFTMELPVLKVPVLVQAKANMLSRYPLLEADTVLYDLADDPEQKKALHDADTETRMAALMVAEMQAHDAPPEAFRRMGLGENH